METSPNKNPIREAVLSAYNEAVYNIAVKFSFVKMLGKDIVLPVNTHDYLLNVFEQKAFELDNVVKNYFENIHHYLSQQLTWRLQGVWPLSQTQIEAVLGKVNFSNFDTQQFIFSPKNVELLTNKITSLVSTQTPTLTKTKAFDGPMIGSDRAIGEIHDNTLLFAFIFILIIVVLFLVVSD